jgi:hypothetical protein
MSTYVCSFALGFIFYLIIEAPFFVLLKVAFEKKKRV